MLGKNNLIFEWDDKPGENLTPLPHLRNAIDWFVTNGECYVPSLIAASTQVAYIFKDTQETFLSYWDLTNKYN